MSLYPGFTDGDLERHANSVRADLRRAEFIGHDERADAAREELEKVTREQERRNDA